MSVARRQWAGDYSIRSYVWDGFCFWIISPLVPDDAYRNITITVISFLVCFISHAYQQQEQRDHPFQMAQSSSEDQRSREICWMGHPD